MSEHNPIQGQDAQSEPTPIVNKETAAKARESLDKAAEDTATVVNQYFNAGVKPSDVHPKRVFGVLAGLALTYFAAKQGVKAGMKDYVQTGQSLVESAGTYADTAQEYSRIASDNAKISYNAVLDLTQASKTLVKAAKKG